MRRALPILILLLIPWVIAWTGPSIADEFKYRDFGITSYPGWSHRQIIVLGSILAALNVSSLLGGLVLFQRRPPPLFWPRAFVWTAALITFGTLFTIAIWEERYLSFLSGGLGLASLFLSERMRFWGAKAVT
ncbi:MAG: hypothetical protein U0984_12590 [Prosthecobacter sp.]|nr:hypothetical protein [Prosthecobacter sp.]